MPFDFERLGNLNGSTMLKPRIEEEKRLQQLVHDTLEFYSDLIEIDEIE